METKQGVGVAEKKTLLQSLAGTLAQESKIIAGNCRLHGRKEQRLLNS